MLSDFDNKQIDLLKEFAERKVVLHFPFFANTFSIAFHYMIALQQDGVNITDLDNYVYEHDWDEPIPVLKEGNANVFFATLDAINKKKKEIETKWDFDCRPISHYSQQYIFAEYRPHIASGFKPKQDKKKFSDELVKVANQCGVNRIEIFTDIPTQADVIQNELIDWGFIGKKKEIKIIKKPIDAILYYEASSKVLRLFYYGAPTTSRMLRENFFYIPYKLTHPETEYQDPTMITCICYVYLKTDQTTGKTKLNFNNLFNYHNNIFNAAEKESRHVDFLNILWAYNRYAERKQHSATFEDTKAFTRCLKEHHQSPPRKCD
ncbi:hypothetical protein MGMO_74c00020 [Methyloglobulus morosus KoM1]|uniref:Uncharacterized protein n=1 Tax=Methyloglobulus morosus KoM1 TaxID=1116472 RepID=V5BFK7_9GAMM|nr:hypothetical protein [Methyloglobulus morosus]ESS72050.1 hypothetical protein MGMO_74c00020 [Methyloglobulus morosus KoM1]